LSAHKKEVVVFLDIDRVLQPLSAQKRFAHDIERLREELATSVDPGYRELSPYDHAGEQASARTGILCRTLRQPKHTLVALLIDANCNKDGVPAG
jgi:hypothetical protein